MASCFIGSSVRLREPLQMRAHLAGVGRARSHIQVLLILAFGVAQAPGLFEARAQGKMKRRLRRRKGDGFFEFRNRRHFVTLAVQRDRQVVLRRVIGGKQIARDLFPADYATQYNLAITLHRKGDEVAAIPEFEKAIALAPAEASFHLALGASLEKAGRLSDAKREYQQYLDMAPSATDAGQVRAHLQGLT